MNNKKVINVLWQVILALVIIVSDRGVKNYILTNCDVGEVFGQIPYIADFIFVRNTGAAFSMLSNSTALLGVISVVFVTGIVIYKAVKKPEGFLINLSIVLLFSGALGNGIDRLLYKFVVDFISVKWFEFPVFNIADIAIVAGAGVMILYMLFFDESSQRK